VLGVHARVRRDPGAAVPGRARSDARRRTRRVRVTTMRTGVRRLTAASAVVPLLALAACGGGAEDTAGDDELGLVTPGMLTVCTTMPAPPFEFEEDGEAKGLEIDLARDLAERLEVDVDFINSPFESIQSAAALETNQCDIARSEEHTSEL